VAEQAINAIYLLASQPDLLCGDIVKEKTRAVFRREARQCSTQEPVREAAQNNDTDNSSVTKPELSSVRGLSQLLFIVGHVASKYTKVCVADPFSQANHSH
jgi:condensin complex subunit 1